MDTLSKWAPAIVILTLLVSLVGVWTNSPEWLLNILAIVIGFMAIVLWAARGLPRQFKSKEELGFARNRHWLAYELAGKGTPRGYKRLGVLGFATILLTGFQSLALAGFMLGVVWGIVNVRYPADGRAGNY